MIVCVTPRWHADIYRTATVFVLLSSPWQRTYRSPKIPAQYQFAQPAHGKQGIKTRAGPTHTLSHTHTCIHRLLEKYSGGQRQEWRQIQTHVLLEWLLKGKRSRTKIGWCDKTLRGKLLKITACDIWAHWPMINIPVILLSLNRKMDFKLVNVTNLAALKMHLHAPSISHYLFQYWFGIKAASNKHSARTSFTVYHLL